MVIIIEFWEESEDTKYLIAWEKWGGDNIFQTEM
jgi:hypothetical protein